MIIFFRKQIFFMLTILISTGTACSFLSSQSIEQTTEAKGHIAFVDSNGNIRMITPDLSEDEVILNGPGNSFPSWSPDGKKLAYIRNATEIWVYDLNTKETVMFAEPILPAPGLSIRMLHWAFDNSRIYYHQGGLISMSAIKCVNVVSYSCDALDLPSWGDFDVSKSGRIVQRTYDQESGGSGLTINDLQGATIQDVIPISPDIHITGPSWSPDESRIALYANERLVIVPSSGGDQTELAEAKTTVIAVTSWSRDGSHIAYQHNDHIWIVDVDGADGPQKIAQGSAPNWGP